MILTARRACRESGLPCRILMDLSGPKLRTGPMMPGPRIIYLRPRRDILGRPTAPAVVLFSSSSARPQKGRHTVIPIPARWLQRLRKGERITFVDTRGKKRTFVIGRRSSMPRSHRVHSVFF